MSDPNRAGAAVCVHRIFLSNCSNDLDHAMRLLRDALRSVRNDKKIDLEATISGADALVQRAESQIEEWLEDEVGEFAQLGRP